MVLGKEARDGWFFQNPPKCHACSLGTGVSDYTLTSNCLNADICTSHLGVNLPERLACGTHGIAALMRHRPRVLSLHEKTCRDDHRANRKMPSLFGAVC